MTNERLVKEPIYQQLNQILRGLISGGEFERGSKFLTERQICARFGVSRSTANKALSNLVSERVLEFRKGVGTFVHGMGSSRDLAFIRSFTSNVIDAGRRPSTQVLGLASLTGSEIDPEAAATINVGPNDAVYRIERVRFADGVPLILERRFVPARCCPRLTKKMLEGSLFTLFEKRFGLKLAGSDERIQAVIIKGEDARLLKVEEGGAGFLVTTVGFLEGDVPLWWESTLHRPDGFELRCRVRPSEYSPGVRRHLVDPGPRRPTDGATAGDAGGTTSIES